MATREPGRSNRNDELERDLAEAIEQQAAAGQMPEVIGRSVSSWRRCSRRCYGRPPGGAARMRA